MSNNIATLDYKQYLNNPRRFAQAMEGPCADTGFFLLRNPKISIKLLEDVRKDCKKFFKLPLEARMEHCHPELSHQIGYTPLGTEKGQFAKRSDYKHFYQVADKMAADFTVREVPGFKSKSQELYHEFDKLYRRLMEAVALSLGLPMEYFDDECGNSIMRLIHYPEQENPTVDDTAEPLPGGNAFGMCAFNHTDINDLTLLYALEAGLQLFYQGRWLPVNCSYDTLIVNIGDMLWHLTAGYYKSSIHRVVCQPGIERFSLPFFGHRHDHCSIMPLPRFGEYDKELFKWKTEGKFLRFRLEEINLARA